MICIVKYGRIDEIEVRNDDVQSQMRSIRQEKISGDNGAKCQYQQLQTEGACHLTEDKGVCESADGAEHPYFLYCTNKGKVRAG